MFEEIVTAQEWLALVVALLLAAGITLGHRRVRQRQALERLVVLVAAPFLTLFGIPPLSIDRTIATPFTGTELFTIAFSTPELLPSVRELLFLIPVFPLDWMLLVGAVAAPVGLLFGHLVASRREDPRARVAFLALGVSLAVAGAVGAPLVDLSSTTGVLLATALFLPLAAYGERLLDRDGGLVGITLPVVLVGGSLLGAYVVTATGIATPEPWLNWNFMTSAASRTPVEAGFYPPLVGSILIIIVVALSAFPVGVGAAIYLEEYAPDSGRLGRFVEFLEINIGNLAGVPSIVYGLLGLALFVNGVGLRDGIVIVAGLTIGLLLLPIVIISAPEAIRAVPDSRRRASYGMGATRWQTVRNVVLPEATPGILTGTILALGRAIGETAPLIMIGVADVVRLSPGGFFDIAAAMPAQIFSWRSEIDPAFREGVMAAGVITLLAVLLVMNATAIILRNKYQRD
jgi:phosphate transport system permease protein